MSISDLLMHTYTEMYTHRFFAETLFMIYTIYSNYGDFISFLEIENIKKVSYLYLSPLYSKIKHLAREMIQHTLKHTHRAGNER